MTTKSLKQILGDIMRFLAPLIAIAITLGILVVAAKAEDQVHSPYAEPGKWEFEQTGVAGTGEDGTRNYTGSIGYGVTPWWHTEGEVEWKNGQFRSLDSENVFVLTGCVDPDMDGDCHETPFAAGIFAEYEHRWSKYRSDSLAVGPIFSVVSGNFVNTLNILTEHAFGVHHDNDWGFSVMAQTLYRVQPGLAVGVEYSGSIEDIQAPGKFNDQEHAFGPVVQYRWNALVGKVGYLFALSDEAEGHLEWRLEYEF